MLIENEHPAVTDSDVSAPQAAGSDPKPTTPDWESRYRGLSREHSKVSSERKRLEEQMGELQSQLIDAQDKLRTFDPSSIEERLKKAESDAQLAKTQLSAMLLKERIANEYPALKSAHAEGLLKDQSAFPEETQYFEYLSKMNAMIAPPPTPPGNPSQDFSEQVDSEIRRKEFLRGGTPGLSASVRPPVRGPARTPAQIANEMIQTTDQNRWAQLEQELARAVDKRDE